MEKSYPNPEDPLIYDFITIEVPAMKESGAVFFTLQAFNGNGGYLNSVQFTVFVNAPIFFDKRDGRLYPAVLLNNQMWMAENLAHNEAESKATTAKWKMKKNLEVCILRTPPRLNPRAGASGCVRGKTGKG